VKDVGGGGGDGAEDVTKEPKYCIHFRIRLPISNTPYLCLQSDSMLLMNYVPLNSSLCLAILSSNIIKKPR
jgi:hypothetical protein